MTYTVHSLFKTIQGEGVNMGRVAVFCRFAGCNLWSGREEDRATATCRFCDTDFVGGTRYQSADALAAAMAALMPETLHRFCVLTGGEPGLQVDRALVIALHRVGFFIAIETNGTKPLPYGVNWICVSPKAGAVLVLDRANEVKLVYPQAGMDPASVRVSADNRWLSPMDGPDIASNTAAAAAYCLEHPEWRLNIQAHKTWGIA